jgi:hypothetical protein
MLYNSFIEFTYLYMGRLIQHQLNFTILKYIKIFLQIKINTNFRIHSNK